MQDRGGNPGMFLIPPTASYPHSRAGGEIFNVPFGLIGFLLPRDEQDGPLAAVLDVGSGLVKIVVRHDDASIVQDRYAVAQMASEHRFVCGTQYDGPSCRSRRP